MDAGLDDYRDRFDGIQTSLSRDTERNAELFRELFEELEITKAALKKTKLDLENECEGRRRLQEEVQDSRERSKRQGRRPFVIALIDADADGYVFQDRFITGGAKGGKDAADALRTALQQYVQGLDGALGEVDILVKAFANLGGLGMALERDGRLREAAQLRTFATGFSSRHPFFDFIDVGAGKERADLKVQSSIDFYLDSSQCKHLVLACAHDTGYEPFLGQFAGDKQVAERITLLEGTPIPRAIRNLELKTTRFASVFMPLTLPADVAGLSHRRRDDASGTTGSLIGHVGQMMTSNTRTQRNNPEAQSDRLGPVLMDERGRRYDRDLQVDPSVMERIKRSSLCFFFFLRGSCVSVNCGKNHTYRSLVDEEFDALWWLARQGRCYRNRKADQQIGHDCADALCVYGHGRRES